MIGYESKEVKVGRSNTLEVKLEQAAIKLDDVVVIGYGKARRKDVTGAISSVSGEELRRTPAATFDQALQGKVAGLVVQQVSGQPGGGEVGGGGGEGELRRMSDETGGRVFKVDRKHTLDEVFQEIQDEMRSQYAIGYTPSNDVKDGSYRRLEVRLANKDLKAQARKGYYAIKPEAR